MTVPYDDVPHGMGTVADAERLRTSLTGVLDALGVCADDVSEVRWYPDRIEVRKAERDEANGKFVRATVFEDSDGQRSMKVVLAETVTVYPYFFPGVAR